MDQVAPASPADTEAAPAAVEIGPAGRQPSRFHGAAPTAYTPKHLAEKILSVQSAVEGERKQVTVMFSDVSGFTAMSERLDPEEVHEIMDRAFQVIIAAVHHYEGNINQFLGDGVMALFGAPIAHEDHPHRALRTALAIQHGLSGLKREVREKHGIRFRVRMGINTGLVFVGAIGQDLRQDYTAVGDTTNLAARLLGLAGPGEVLVSAHTQHLTDGFFEFRDRGDFTVKGKAEPVRVYQVTKELRGRTRLEVSRERGLTPLVGRTREMARLDAAYRRAADGQGAIVLVSGEPGMGKSRLLFEVLQQLEAQGVRDLEATGVAHGRSIPYLPIVELVRRYLDLAEGAAPATVRRRVAERLGALGIEGEEPGLLLLHFLGLPVPQEFLTRLAGGQLKERTLRVLTTLWLKASEARPLVLVVENVHWVDHSSEEFLQHLAQRLADHPLLLLLSTRPEYSADWLAPTPAETITIGGLGADEVRGMVAALLKAEAVSPPLLELLVTKGEGNPLYIEEILRQLGDTRGILVQDGEVQLAADDVKVPATIHDIIAARIDRLPDPVKHTLQVAAVVGRQFAVSLLSRVIEASVALADHLHDLEAQDFVFVAGQDPHPVYSFKHALTQDVAYGSLLERRRRVYHAAVGAGLEEFHAGRTEDVVELLAHHYERSREDEKAIDYAILAAEKAQRRWANKEALAYFETAVKRLEPMPDTEPNRLRRIDTVVKQAEVKFALGRQAEHVEALEKVRHLVEVAADPPRRAAWHYWAGFLHSFTGSKLDIPVALCREAAAIAEATGLEDIRAYAECCLAQVYLMTGDLREAIAVGERALDFFETHGNLWWACRTLWQLSPVANALGDWERSLRYCRLGLEHGQSINDLRLKVVAWLRMGSTHIQRGDWEAGLRCCDEALALSPVAYDVAMVQAVRAYGQIKAGDAERGTAELAETVAWFDRSHLRYTRSLIALWLAEGHLHHGRWPEARGALEEVLATSRELGYRHLEGVAHRFLGEALAPEDPRAAAEHLDAALRVLRHVDAQNEVAKALVAQAGLRWGAGDAVAATQLLEDALGIFERLDTLDGPPRVRAILAILAERMRVGSAARHVVIVSRELRALHQDLARDFAGDAHVQVILDRRAGERRQAAPVDVPERRRSDRRSRLEVDAGVHAAGYAVLTHLSGA